jgi:hypothetical protein
MNPAVLLTTKASACWGVSNVVANPVALKVKTGKELSSQPTMLIRATWSLTRFFLPVEDNNAIIDHLLEHVLAVRFPGSKS